ncbi:hypothetical protein QVD17_16241 [Tagetes erecta]|uniref:Uncharacterized protein n=1 Tax=Tagetes erecta TaxID=13708 RepID=A0AAD8KRS6_TARER|nr:hypothetical protein QVD17_16241 [Tagetes erecta]
MIGLKRYNICILMVVIHHQSSEDTKAAYCEIIKLTMIISKGLLFCPMSYYVFIGTGILQKELWKGYKILPHLKVCELYKMKNLLSTPDFDAIPCLQKLTIHHCDELNRIHPSLGYHTSLENVSVLKCPKLKMLPKIVHMGKLSTLEIKSCHKSLEFPEIKSSMESLEKVMENHSMSLCLQGLDIANGFMPPLVRGTRCTLNLASRELHVTSGMDFGDDVVWRESDNDKRTLVWYVSFASLRHSAWWNETYKRVSFSFGIQALDHEIDSLCSGFGVKLVARESGNGTFNRRRIS